MQLPLGSLKELERRVGLKVSQVISRVLVVAASDCQIVSIVRQTENLSQ